MDAELNNHCIMNLKRHLGLKINTKVLFFTQRGQILYEVECTKYFMNIDATAFQKDAIKICHLAPLCPQ